MGLQHTRDEEMYSASIQGQVEAAKKRKAKAEEAAEKAIRNPRPLPKRKRAIYAPQFGYRVVRRHGRFGETWLEMCDVHYVNG